MANPCHMANSGSSDNTPPWVIKHALAQIGKHPHVDAVGPVEIDADGICLASVPIRTNLPTAWRAAGESPTGVQLVEQVVFQFPVDYPANPPKIYLRNDFNRSLPHIQPGLPGDPVEPCYLDGDPRELLHRQGIGDIVNQLVYWLERAAKDELIDREQGWEPIRRDVIDDYAVVEHSYLRQLVQKHSAFRFLPVEYVKFIAPPEAQIPGKGYLFYGSVLPEPVSVNRKSLGDLRVSQPSSKGFQFGESIAIFATPGKLPSGDPFVCDQYLPETVTNLSMLVQQAHNYGCGKELEDALSHLQRQTADIPTVTESIPILVVLCARRPTHLIGSSSNLELIPYLLETPAPMFTDDHAAIPVHPVALRHAISPQLLRDVSGINTPDDRILVQLGCGSLGSKIALHMARAGLAPTVVADSRTMSPHNAARHALVPSKERFNILWMIPKAEALADAINGLGQSAEAANIDAVSLGTDKKRLWKVIPKKTWAVVNSTASLAVRDTLGALPTAIMPARVIETSLFAGGSVGLMTIEGPDRNPNTSDLVHEAYEMIRADESIRERFFGINGNLERQEIGQGCSSTTMVMPDSDISLFSASMARKLLAVRQQELPESGQTLIGRLVPDGLGLTWTSVDVGPYHCVQAENDPSWQIRISPHAHEMISEECGRYQDVETGGIIVGSASEIRKTITITNVLPAPVDSQRSAASFILGTQGVNQMVEDYAKPTGFTLHCVGTWHSHLQESGGSHRDYQTAALIAAKIAVPSVLLIKTPSGYRAILAKAD
ncbi:MAG: hypothetical protein KME56_06000 [Candidatus Thiodiazotropha sp. (ex Ctena orbiculata)]|nr:hypothetical protein [Candidatus Thiodiazotropha taylori]MBT2996166.1 hypothetical protein [Candidatus Thiodiazotropha taylori]MBV2106333.1 hypothetical protein [Candidatus Thiodiazotropha taylori]MBV2110465.1 hypothetical protein [Candidatus Thiodiazotropha taylori]